MAKELHMSDETADSPKGDSEQTKTDLSVGNCSTLPKSSRVCGPRKPTVSMEEVADHDAVGADAACEPTISRGS